MLDPNPSRRSFVAAGLGAATSAFVAGCSSPVSARPLAPNRTVRSCSRMAVAPDGRLVLADWRAASLHVVELPSAPAGASGAFHVLDLEAVVAANQGAGRARATHAVWLPGRSHAVIALEMEAIDGVAVRLAMVAADGAVTVLDPDEHVRRSTPIEDAPGPDARIWRRTPVRSFVVTDLQFVGDELFVAGLANADFGSTLRRMPYPFTGSATVSAIEIYHAVHDQIETRAPIRAMTAVELAGRSYVLAAYTCTPLVLIPVDELVDGAAVRGKTIAELGYGNTPVAMASFDLEQGGPASRWTMLLNSAKSADLLSHVDLAAAAAAPGLSRRVSPPFDQHAGLRANQVPITGAIAIADQGPGHVLVVRRDADSGSLQVVSYRKGAFFRLSDHVNEYDVPGYEYPQDDPFQQQYIRPFHALMRGEEGFPELAR